MDLRHAPLPAVLALVLLAACGSTPEPAAEGRGPVPRQEAPTPRGGPGPPPRSPLLPPEDVPSAPSGPADDADVAVVREWTDRLRGGDVPGAARLWATPSRAQNGSPVLTLADREAVEAFNASLPCGAVVTGATGARRGFTIVDFRLTSRQGARCAGGQGGGAQSAIRVEDGRITEWYRLPGEGGPPPGSAPA